MTTFDQTQSGIQTFSVAELWNFNFSLQFSVVFIHKFPEEVTGDTITSDTAIGQWYQWVKYILILVY